MLKYFVRSIACKIKQRINMTNKKGHNVKVKSKDKNKQKIRPDLSESFQGSVIKDIISDVLENVLEGVYIGHIRYNGCDLRQNL